jgi:hypothetical protein
MKLTLNGALDLSKSINGQTIWNKRSVDFFNKVGRDLQDDMIKVVQSNPSPISKSSKSTGKLKKSIYWSKLRNTNRLRMSEGVRWASTDKKAIYIHGKPIYRGLRPIKKTKPFFPPYQEGTELAKWAARGTPKMNPFLVARAISQRGLKMKAFIGGVVYKERKNIERDANKMLERIAKDIARSVK